MSFSGRVAIVTGASRGIGKEIALSLAQAGAKVACIATKPPEAVAQEISSSGGEALAYGCDVSSAESVAETVNSVVEKLGSVDILVNNAGITRDQLILRMSEEDWDTVIAVNLKGAFNMIRASAKPMTKARYGRIINITSIVGLHGQAGQANYAASKAGLVGLTKSVAKELGSRSITCNALAPGFIETDMTHGLSDEMRQNVIKAAPLGRLGQPGDIASVVKFFASDAASYITGQVLEVDGGLSL